MTRPLPIVETDLQAYVDGRLGDERRVEVEDWLAARPAEASRIADYRMLREQWRAAYAEVLEEAVPETILGTLQGARQRPRRFARLAAAIAAGALIGALGVWQLPQWWQAASSGTAAAEMVQRAAVAHA